MTDTVQTKKESKKPALIKKGVTIVGKAKFTNLTRPDETYQTLQAAVTVPVDDPQVAMLTELYKEAVAAERARITKAKQAGHVDGPFKALQVDMDKEENETGLMMIKASRKDKLGLPGVYLVDGTPVDKNIIERGSDLELHVTARSYVSPGGLISMTLQLENVKILREEPSTFVPGLLTPDKPIFEFTPSVSMDSAESPF